MDLSQLPAEDGFRQRGEQGLALVAATLFYVYPLRMVMSAGMHFLTGGWAPSELTVSSFDQFRLIFVLYGAGFATLATIMALLNRHALRRADAPGLMRPNRNCCEGISGRTWC